MDVNFIFRIAAIGIIVAVLNQLLVRSGREEQAMMTTLAGLIVVLMMIIQQIDTLFQTSRPYLGYKMEIVALSGIAILAAILAVMLKKYNRNTRFLSVWALGLFCSG